MRYPYFINPDIDALPSATGEERVGLMRHIAACVGDEAALRTILGIDPEEFRNFYPDMNPRELSTEDTITSFISRFSSESAAETPRVEEIIAAPAIDYASMLDEEETGADSSSNQDVEKDTTADAISAFLQAVPAKTPVRKKQNEPQKKSAGAVQKEAQGDPDLNEALFKLMVKNKNYAKALEIISELNLNNPKKSVYFAVQKRFLEKLIANESGRK